MPKTQIEINGDNNQTAGRDINNVTNDLRPCVGCNALMGASHYNADAFCNLCIKKANAKQVNKKRFWMFCGIFIAFIFCVVLVVWVLVWPPLEGQGVFSHGLWHGITMLGNHKFPTISGIPVFYVVLSGLLLLLLAICGILFVLIKRKVWRERPLHLALNQEFYEPA